MLSLSQITTITGACGNASASMPSRAMKSAARRRPSRYTQRPLVTSIAPNTVTCRFLPGVGI
jgi:transcriptional regulator GlxA family with amidase domain